MTSLSVFCASYLPSSKRIDSPTFKKECFHIPCTNLHTLLEERLVLHREAILDASQLSLNDLMGVDVCNRLTGSGIAIEQCSLMIQKIESVCAQHFPHWAPRDVRRVFCGSLFLARVISNVDYVVTEWRDSAYFLDIPFRDLGEAIAYLIEYDRRDQIAAMLNSPRFSVMSIEEHSELFWGIAKVMTTMEQHENHIMTVILWVVRGMCVDTNMFLGILFLSAARNNARGILTELRDPGYSIPAEYVRATCKELSRKCVLQDLAHIIYSTRREVFSNQDMEDIFLNIVESGGSDSVAVIMEIILSWRLLQRLETSADVFVKGLIRAIELDRVAVVQIIIDHPELKNISSEHLKNILKLASEKNNQIHMLLLQGLLKVISLGFSS